MARLCALGKIKSLPSLIPYRPDTKVAPWYLPWWSTFFYEALSAEYSLSIPHDVPGLVELCGGKEAFIKRLHTFFANKHYNVANEPSFMTPYLYHWVDRPDLSVARIRQIVNDNYNDTPLGLPGNDDSGAMSSWLVFNMMGLYPVAGQNLYLVGSPLIPEYTIHLENGKKLQVVRDEKMKSWDRKFLTHELLTNGGKLVLPGFSAVDSIVDNDAKLLISNQKERFPRCEQDVDNLLKSIPSQGISHFVLNRQYRNWELGATYLNGNRDTLYLKCNQSVYLIPERLVDEATGFSWDSPQKGKNIYVCNKSQNKGMHDGTFLFISRKALQQLLHSGTFIYNDITWRQVSRDAKTVVVRADIDGTTMCISLCHQLPWVLWMKNNPLGIDWTLTGMLPDGK